MSKAKEKSSPVSQKNEDRLNRPQFWFLIGIGVILGGLLIAFITDSSILIGKCRNNVPVEHCNNPAGDFAVEPDSSSANVEFGCGPDEKSACIFYQYWNCN